MQKFDQHDDSSLSIAELLYAAPPVLTDDLRSKLIQKFAEDLGEVKIVVEESSVLQLVFEKFVVQFPDGKEQPAGMIICKVDAENLDSQAVLETSLGQTWNWAGAREAVAAAPHRLLVCDFMGQGLEPAARITLFQTCLHTVVSLLPCEAIHFPHAQCLVNPTMYRDNIPGGEGYFSLLGIVNVRLFSIGSLEAEEMVMDTLGMYIFGQPDVQCHCKSVDPSQLGSWLYSFAQYVAGNVETIKNGDVVTGVSGLQWAVQYENALIEPERIVLDVHMGEYAAGHRASGEEAGEES